MTAPSKSRNRGAIAAEYMAALVFLFLVIMFPLVNLATVTYRYNMLVGAVHAAAHAGATAPTFTGPSDGVMAVVPQTMKNYLTSVIGISNPVVDFRINEATIKDQIVAHDGWQAKLKLPADSAKLYSIEVVVQADVQPLIMMPQTGFIPAIPGISAPSHYSVSAQELVENTSGLNQ